MSDWVTDAVRAKLAAERAAKAAQEVADLEMFRQLHNGTATSKAAAERVAGRAAAMRHAVLLALADAPAGLTRQELMDRTGINENSINPRCFELRNQLLVKEHGRREGRSVLHITDKGRQHLRQAEAA